MKAKADEIKIKGIPAEKVNPTNKIKSKFA